MSPDIAAVDCEKDRREKNEDWLQLRMEEKGEGRREDNDEQGGVVVVIALTLRENIVTTGEAGGAGHVVTVTWCQQSFREEELKDWNWRTYGKVWKMLERPMARQLTYRMLV